MSSEKHVVAAGEAFCGFANPETWYVASVVAADSRLRTLVQEIVRDCLSNPDLGEATDEERRYAAECAVGIVVSAYADRSDNDPTLRQFLRVMTKAAVARVEWPEIVSVVRMLEAAGARTLDEGERR